MDEERSNSILRALFKVIIVVIFILFIIWLLSVSVRKSNTVVTDNKVIDTVYQQNLDRMKDAGISYYTLERLPKNVGDMKKITLGEMYDAHLLLEIMDEDGNACSSDDSYIEVVKLENEYKMKVKLECPKKDAYIIVYLGCYDYCKGFICEKSDGKSEIIDNGDHGDAKGNLPSSSSNSNRPSSSSNPKPSSSSSHATVTEYEYVKRTDGHWTDWSAWSKWQKNPVTASDTVRVETKVVSEEYTYEEEEEQIVYADVIIKCPNGYEPAANGKKCRKVTEETTSPVCPSVSGYTLIGMGKDGWTCVYRSNSQTADPICPTVSGYTLIGRDGDTCTYKSNKTYDPECPTVSGYTLIGRDGNTCTYKSNTTYDPVCPEVSGYTLIGQSGNTCTYKSNTTYEPVCPTVSGYTLIGRDGFTCTYKSNTTYNPVCPTVSGYTLMSQSGLTCTYKSNTTVSMTCPSTPSGYTYVGIEGGKCIYKKFLKKDQGPQIPANTSTRIYEYVAGPIALQDCDGCGYYYGYIWNVYIRKAIDKVCPSGYTNIGGSCHKVITRTATCPSGTENLNGICVKKITRQATCPSGTELLNGVCVKKITRQVVCPSGTENLNGICVKKITRQATCPSGTELLNGVCVKKITRQATCPSGYIYANGNCFKEITKPATCPSGYEKINNKCKKVLYANYEKSCPQGYEFTDKSKEQCFKKDVITVIKHGVREVTYYRFATREYVGGFVDYKWSTSNHDQNLLNQGYVLTGRTRQRG